MTTSTPLASTTSFAAPATGSSKPEPSRPWRRHAVKAAVAGTLALGLLTAGGGTFSKWYEEQPLANSTLTGGSLSMATLSAPQWRDQNGPIDLATYRMVPGDTVTMTTTTTITAVGDNLRAALGVDDSHVDFANAASRAAGIAVWTTISGLTDTDGSDGYSIIGQKGATVNDNGRTATVTFTVSWPAKRADGTDWGSGFEAGEEVSRDLSKVRVVLTQVP